jgi:hypothetical protein
MIKKIFAAVAFVAATPAFAVPIQFDISGTTQYYSFQNFVTGETGGHVEPRSFTMQFVFDTDAFGPGVMQEYDANRVLRFDALGNAYSGSFTIDGVTTPMTLEQNLVQLQFADSNGTVDTPEGPVTGLDGVNLQLVGLPQDLGGSEFTALFFHSYGDTFSEYIDLDDPYSPENLFDVDLPGAWMFYVHQTASCDVTCSQTFGESWGFNVESIVRTNRSVPEPGTLSLLALGLLGAGFARRRRQAD